MQVKPGCPSCPIQRASENLSDCGAAPYLRFFLVRNEEAGGSNPLSSTRFQSTYIIFENRVNCRCTDLSTLSDGLEAEFVRRSDSLVPQPDRGQTMQVNFNACFQQLTMVSGLHRS